MTDPLLYRALKAWAADRLDAAARWLQRLSWRAALRLSVLAGRLRR